MQAHTGNGFTWYWTPSLWSWNPANGPWQPKYGSPKTSVYLEVSCRSMKPHLAYDYWRENVFHNFEPDYRPPGAKRSFKAEAQALLSQRGSLFAYQSDPISGRRTHRQARASDDSAIELGLVLAGTRYAEQHVKGRISGHRETKAGSFFAYDPTQPCRIVWKAHRGVHIELPRSAVAAATGGQAPSPDVLMNMLNSSRMAPFVRTQLRLLARDLPRLSLAERTTLFDHTVDLLLTALRTTSQSHPTESPLHRQDLYAAAQRYIEDHLVDPDLNADRIAAAIGCSRSTLYRAFAEQQLTVADCIRERRFQYFLHLLQEAPRHLTITALAHRCGLRDGSHLSKAFKLRFGMSPKDARAACRLAGE